MKSFMLSVIFSVGVNYTVDWDDYFSNLLFSKQTCCEQAHYGDSMREGYMATFD